MGTVISFKRNENGEIIICSESTANLRTEKGKSLLQSINEYTAIDIETTGLDTDFDEIIELGAIHVKDGKAVAQYETLVNPQMELDDFIVELTGITNDMIQEAPTLEKVLPDFLEFIGDSTVIGHNVNFDVNFVYDKAIRLLKRTFPNSFIDTMRLSRHLYPDLENHKLSTLASFLGVSKSAHRSLSDCSAVIGCYEKMKQFAADNGIDIDSLVKGQWLRAKDISAKAECVDTTNPLYGKTCVFTGTLEKMPRREAMQLVADLGGFNGDTVTKKTNYLVLGNADYSKIKNGKSNKQRKAEELILKGKDLEILSENAFFDLISQ